MSLAYAEQVTSTENPYDAILSGEQAAILDGLQAATSVSRRPKPEIDQKGLMTVQLAGRAIELARQEDVAIDIQKGLTAEQQICIRRAVGGYAVEALAESIDPEQATELAYLAMAELGLAYASYGEGLVSPQAYDIVVSSLEHLRDQPRQDPAIEKIVATETLNALAGATGQSQAS